MVEKLYGKTDNPDLLDKVREFAKDRGAEKLMVAMHQRIPVDARPCQFPGSMLFEFQINDDKAYAVREYANGKLEWLGV